MIFAKVDVGLPRHHRFLRIPAKTRAAAIGVWLTALCYSRDEQLDGFCPFEVIQAIATQQVLAALIDVGLFALAEINGVSGYTILKYAEKNETKAEIQARLAADRRRKSSPGATDSARIPIGIPKDSSTSHPPECADFPGSDSDSGSDSGSQIAAPVPVQPVPQAAEAERYIQPTDKLTDELRAVASMTTVQDIDAAWLKFCGYYAGKWHHVTGKWQQWCVTEAKRERIDRERRFTENRPKEPPLELPGLVKKREDDEREKRRRQDAEWEQRKREAAPPPMGALFAALQPKPPKDGAA